MTPELIFELKRMAVEAGEAIMSVYNSDFDDSVAWKQDDSPLTLADKQAHEIIEKGLQSLGFDYPIISEEGVIPPFEERKKYAKYWLVDPLDGTREFVNRTDEFTVNIALIEGGYPVFGIIYIPLSREMYWAGANEGAFVDKGEGPQRMQAGIFHENDQGLKILCSRSHLSDKTKAFINRYNEPEIVAAGSSLKFLLIANGEADIYPRLGPTMEWDTAAAQIILEEAGGAVVEFNNKSRLKYNKKDLRNPFFIAQGRGEFSAQQEELSRLAARGE